jgi:nuclear pore complex protein Nup155
LDLLWRHYDYKKDYLNAAKVLTALAEKYSETQITLKERVEYLTQAIVALNSSCKMGAAGSMNSSVKDEIAELNDKKDVALLQEKIYDELMRVEPRNESVQEALNQLDSQLYDITKVGSNLKAFTLIKKKRKLVSTKCSICSSTTSLPKGSICISVSWPF